MAEETTTTSMVNSDWINNSDRQSKINSTYDTISTDAQNNLTTANTEGNALYDQNQKNMADLYSAKEKEVADEFDRQTMTNNRIADETHLNRGAGSQLGMSNRAQAIKNSAVLNQSQEQQSAQNDLARQKMNIQYTNSMAEAVANGDYVKAAALLDEYSNEYDNMSKQAESASTFGDFSGYETLYGKEAADNMKTVWEYQNPLIAYNLGQITADKYYQLTGSYPPGYVVYSGGGDWYGDYTEPTKTTSTVKNGNAWSSTLDNWMVTDQLGSITGQNATHAGWTVPTSTTHTSSSGTTHGGKSGSF